MVAVVVLIGAACSNTVEPPVGVGTSAVTSTSAVSNGSTASAGGEGLIEGTSDQLLPVANGGEVVNSRMSNGFGAMMITYPLDRYDEIVSYYEAWLDANGYSIDKQITEGGAPVVVLNAVQEGDGSSSITITIGKQGTNPATGTMVAATGTLD